MNGTQSPAGIRADIVLEIVEGPMDGSVLASDQDVIALGRNPGNDIILAGDPLVSGNHAQLSRTADPRVWQLEDRNSSNGTWVQGELLIAPHPLSIGEHFLVGGQSVVRLRAPTDQETFLLFDEELSKERQRILGRLPTSINSAIGAAAMLAGREMRDSLNERHLFLGIAMTEADMPIFERGKGMIGDTMLRRLLWQEGFWSEHLWIDERVRQVKIEQFFAYKCAWTPRLIRLLQKAQAASKERGRPRTETVDVLRILISDASSRVHQWLIKHGVSVEQALNIFDSSPMSLPQDPTLTGNDSTQWASAEVKPPEPKPAPRETTGSIREPDRVLSTGELHLDQSAQETGSKLYGLASLYHLADPVERAQGMRRLLEKHMAEVPQAKRREWLQQVRRLFPLDLSADSEALKLEQLHGLVAELRERIAELENQSGGASLPWQLVLGKPAPGDLDALSPSDRPRVEMLRELFQFGLRQEQFLIQMVQDLTMKFTNETAVSVLPGHHMTLQSFLNDMQSSRQVRMEELRDYLADLDSWLISGVWAFNAGPEEWFKEFWKTYNPRTFEARTDGGIVGNLGISLWRSYKEAARQMSPDIAGQLMRRKTQEIAKSKHRDLMERRNPNV